MSSTISSTVGLVYKNISGSLPKACFGNFTEMKKVRAIIATISYSYISSRGPREGRVAIQDDKVQILWKGKLSEFGSTLELVKSIDLSSNMLGGEIPREITRLHVLVSLNLSRNNLSGEIPAKIGNMKSLDVLDLSSNHLFDQIPQSLATIDRLGVLDLSKSNLWGKIPTSTQLQSNNASASMDNPGLCGDPLPKKCPGEEQFPSKPTKEAVDDQEDENEFVSRGFYVSMGVGYVVGFWGVCGTLLFNKTWRLAYFKVLNDLADWIYVMVAVRKAKLLRTFKSL
ncbi:hypothetical protein FEM48_Zijuj07G0172400 [Ziziphus jujuba var. spinosa]|uniref:Receptor-like protein EIX2 n=1 Tax=Ziziphus jujuba var. spinosa TaxID=714518 RepID=A0A978V5X5_ZIZJJ|nr:hypothetical protein FEM48_Zijuj07G0172400 [Ziziphus jujuba var. spinosa]